MTVVEKHCTVCKKEVKHYLRYEEQSASLVCTQCYKKNYIYIEPVWGDDEEDRKN